MKKTVFYLIIFIFFISFKDSKIQKQESVFSKETIKDSIKKNTFTSDSLKLISPQRDTLISLKQKEETNKNDFFGKELIGLGIKDSSATDIYKKYWIDFNTICYPSALSLYIDISKKRIYAYDYTFYFEEKKFSIDDISISYVFHIDSFNINENTYSFEINMIKHMYLEESEKIQYNPIVLNFRKINRIQIYELSIKEDDENYFSNTLRYKRYTIKSLETDFTREDCGDFDG